MIYTFDYVATKLVAVQASDGKLLWQTPIAMLYKVALAPLIVQDEVYFKVAENIDVFDKKTGILKRSLHSSTTFDADTFIIDKGVLFMAATTPTFSSGQTATLLQKVTALNSTTGAFLWETPISQVTIKLIGDGVTQAPLAVRDGVLYAAGWDGNLYALDSTSGKVQWHLPTITATLQRVGFSSLSLDQGVVYFYVYPNRDTFSGNSAVFAVQLTDHTVRWKQKLLSLAPIVVANGLVYVATGQPNGPASASPGPFDAFNAQTGAQQWQYNDPYNFASAFIVLNNLAYLNEGRYLAALDATGNKFWEFGADGNAIFTLGPLFSQGSMVVVIFKQGESDILTFSL